VFISSFFVLGGDFWDKFRALFVYHATAHFRSMRPHPRPVRTRFVGVMAPARPSASTSDRHEKVSHTGAHVAVATFGT
jgi:hypothetical protein